MTRVSIVSVWYNRADHVATSIESLLAQTHDDLEIILCDDGSTDATLAELRKFDDPRLIILSQANAGFVVTMNRMIASATGDYIAVHGSGDVSLPERIARQAAVLDSDPDTGVVSCWIEARGDIKRPRGWDKDEAQPLRSVALEGNPFSHGEVMFRRSVFEAVGGYRPIFAFAQDRDLWLRMGLHTGYRVVPETLYRRFNLPGSVSRSGDKVILQKKLSAFAVQCARSVDAGYGDPVDRYGASALLLAERSSRLAYDLFRLGIGAWRRGETHEAATLFKAAAREDRGLFGGLARVAGLVVR